jgi:ABC-type multidrug transport system ATPase subunit
MDAIVVDGLTKRYKGVQALDGISFAVREGEVFGLLGPNGAARRRPCGGGRPRRPP